MIQSNDLLKATPDNDTARAIEQAITPSKTSEEIVLYPSPSGDAARTGDALYVRAACGRQMLRVASLQDYADSLTPVLRDRN
ncbi:hypothetical protein [Nostoc sp. NMS9]|uniref:hypothetical protein n=1 Tax=Nostoc sp. NMS9 TaxID=2815393 RepID=UPI0025FC4B57|nr:hypothetical protein [Nostoc sp. NMS9]